MELKRIGIARTPSGVRSIPIRLIENDIAFQKSDVNFFVHKTPVFLPLTRQPLPIKKPKYPIPRRSSLKKSIAIR